MIMIFLMIFGSIAFLTLFGFFLWRRYKDLLEESVINQSLADDYKAGAITSWVFAGLFVLFVLCLFSSIKRAAKIISAAADFINERKRALFVPIILTLVTGGFMAWWIISFAYLFSAGDLRYDKGDIFGDMTWSTHVQVGVYMFIFALLWFLSFILSTNIFVIACLTAGWYFARYDKSHEASLR